MKRPWRVTFPPSTDYPDDSKGWTTVGWGETEEEAVEAARQVWRDHIGLPIFDPPEPTEVRPV